MKLNLEKSIFTMMLLNDDVHAMLDTCQKSTNQVKVLHPQCQTLLSRIEVDRFLETLVPLL